jgi:hypothetical protein
MNESTYDKINNHFEQLFTNYMIFQNKDDGGDYGKETVVFDEHTEFQLCLEIDEFVKEYPDTNKKYLIPIQEKYRELFAELSGLFKNEKIPNKIRNLYFVVGYIDEHLTELLTPKNEIQEQPQKFEKLKPSEKILIIHYLEISSLKRYLFNSKSGTFFLSRLLDINPVSIKKPLFKLDDYTTNKLTEGQARTIFPVLEKVKSFFDYSELNELSKVVETRMKELKIILGKD